MRAGEAKLDIHLLGGFWLHYGKAPVVIRGMVPKSLLAYLVTNNGSHSRDILVDRLWNEWSESRPEEARGNLRSDLRHLRQSLSAGGVSAENFLSVEGAQIRFNAEAPYRFDVEEFEKAITPGGERETEAGKIQRLQAAYSIYAGEFMKGFYSAYHQCNQWCDQKREELWDLYLEEVVQELVQYHKDREDYHEAVRISKRFLELCPVIPVTYRNLQRREVAHRELMYLYYYTQGAREAAKEQYRTCCLELSELNREPSSKTIELFEDIQAGKQAMAPSLERAIEFPKQIFVNRQNELEELKGQWVETKRGHGQIALIKGGMGIGKTSLVEEFLRLIGDDALVVRRRCYREAQNLPYDPVIQALLSQIAMPEILKLLELGNTQAIRTGLTVAVMDLARRQPTILFFDSMEWADQSTISFLHHLSQSISHAPIMLIGAFRHDELSKNGTLRSLVNSLVLEGGAQFPLVPFSEELIAELLKKCLQTESAETSLFSEVYSRSQGNPLFATELIRHFVRKGLITQKEDDIWYFNIEQLTEQQIPDRLGKTIEQRLEYTSRPESKILKLASVIGRPFTIDLLSRTSGMSREQLLNGLDACRDIIILRDKHYEFQHELVQQVVYNLIDELRRATLHSQIARIIEEIYTDRLDEVAGDLAHHFYEADNWGKAWDYFVLAGKRAKTISAYAESLRLFQQALDIAVQQLKDKKKQGAAEIHIGSVYGDQGKFTTALKYYEQAYQTKRKVRDRIGQAYAKFGMASVLGSLGKIPEGLKKMKDVVKIAESEKNHHLQAFTLHNMGTAYLELGRYDDAMQMLKKASAVIRKDSNKNSYLESLIYVNQGSVLCDCGDFQRATDCLNTGLSVAQDNHNQRVELLALGNLGLVEKHLGRYPEAQARFADARRISEEIQNAEAEVDAIANLAEILDRMGNHVEGLATIDKALKLISEQSIETRSQSVLWAQRAVICLNSGEPVRALEDSKKAIQLVRKNRQVPGVYKMYFSHYKVLLANGQRSAAKGYLAKAYNGMMKIANTIKNKNLRKSFLERDTENKAILEQWKSEFSYSPEPKRKG